MTQECKIISTHLGGKDTFKNKNKTKTPRELNAEYISKCIKMEASTPNSSDRCGSHFCASDSKQRLTQVGWVSSNRTDQVFLSFSGTITQGVCVLTCSSGILSTLERPSISTGVGNSRGFLEPLGGLAATRVCGMASSSEDKGVQGRRAGSRWLFLARVSPDFVH